MTRKKSNNHFIKTVLWKSAKILAVIFSFVIPVFLTGLLLVGSDEFKFTGWSKFNTIGDYTSKALFIAPLVLAIVYFIKKRWTGRVITKMAMTIVTYFITLQFIIFIVFGQKLNIKTAKASHLSHFYDIANVAYIVEIVGLIGIFGFLLWYLLFKAKLNQKSQTLLGLGLGVSSLLMIWHVWSLRTTFLNPISSGMSPKIILQYLQIYAPTSDLRYTTNIYTINMSYAWVSTAILLGYVTSSFVWSKIVKYQKNKKGDTNECLESPKTPVTETKNVSQHQSSKSKPKTKRQLKRLKNKS